MKTNSQFRCALPVWPRDREREMNLTVGFRTIFIKGEEQGHILRITASSVYRFYINGQLAGYGPARGPHGYYRVDEWQLTDTLAEGENIIAVEVAGYNVNSYYLLDQPSFLQAELEADGRIIVQTSPEEGSFEAFIVEERIKKVQRYSFQRTFSEAYRLHPGWDRWKKTAEAAGIKTTLEQVVCKQLLARGVAYPEFSLKLPVCVVSEGIVKTDATPERYWRDRSLTDIGPILKGFREEELEMVLSKELDEMVSAVKSEKDIQNGSCCDWRTSEETYRIIGFETDTTGFISFKFRCDVNTRIILTFDEILSDGEVDYKRLSCVNAVSIEFEPGAYQFETMEPYTLKYLKVIVLRGECSIEELRMIEYAHPNTEARFKCSDELLNSIFEAGVETFRQNAVDLFMDCPSRERAGWLCDSFFLARVEHDLTGKNRIERNFFENYLLPPEFEFLPEGVLPMCYPADHNDGIFIPNWMLWFVLELEEYSMRSGDDTLVYALKDRVYASLEYFEKFKNEQGLLENLESWVFIEWSRANDFIQDVNFPTNMLYAGALAAAGRIYQDKELLKAAEKVGVKVRELSFTGQFFADNAVREGGILRTTNNKTEVCQYYAFLFDIATPETHAELWETVVKGLGPLRDNSGAYADVYPANLLMGYCSRLELMSRYHLKGKLINEVKVIFDGMVKKTGTLWENVHPQASCNHGFASHVVHWMYRDLLGIRKIDRENKRVDFKFPGNVGTEWCRGRIPCGNSCIEVHWRTNENHVEYDIKLPEGYTANIL